MAQYTMTLMTVIESLALVERNKTKEDYNTISEFVEDNFDLVFEEYEIFDEEYRSILNRKIVDHFLFHEISETPYGRWEYMFNRRLREIMPYYNQLYKSELGIEDMINDVDYKETLDRTVDTDTLTESERLNESEMNRKSVDNYKKDLDTTTTQNESGTTDNDSETNNSNVPISLQNNLDKPTSSSQEKNKGKSTNKYEGVGNEKETREEDKKTDTKENVKGSSKSMLDSGTHEIYTKHFIGKKSSYSMPQLILDYRKTLLNIDMLVVEDMKLMFRFMFN